MSTMILSDALQLKKLVREAEALSDEAMIACAKLKQAMLQARQNPEIPVDTGLSFALLRPNSTPCRCRLASCAFMTS